MRSPRFSTKNLRNLAAALLVSVAGSVTVNAQTVFLPGGSVGTSTNSNTGIGTSAPGTTLHLWSATNNSGGILVEDASGNNGNIATLELRGSRYDANASLPFSGALYLSHLRTDQAMAGPSDVYRQLGTIAFGANHTDENASNIAYAASIGALAENTFNSATDMPTALVFRTGVSGTVKGALNATVGTERLRITSTGNVGLGSVAPLAKLEVEKPWGAGGPNDVAALFGGKSVDAGRFNTYIVAHTIGVGYGNDTDDAALWINYRGYLAGNTRYRDFFIGNGRQTALLMTKGSTGRVGVGTYSPAARLHVLEGTLGTSVGSRLDIARFGASTANAERLEVFTFRRAAGGDWTTSDLVMQRTVDSTPMGYVKFTDKDTVIGSDSTDYLTVKYGGNVGIGTTSPTNKLEVNGTIRAKEVVVESTGWPDYVFESGYSLPTVREVAAHIEDRGHLPGVPSAQEIAEQGVGVGEMQATLLRKVEELTLYIIQQERRIADLEARVNGGVTQSP